MHTNNSSTLIIMVVLVAALACVAQADQTGLTAPVPTNNYQNGLTAAGPTANYQTNRKLMQELLDKEPRLFSEILSGQLTPTGMQGMQQGMQGMQGMHGMHGMQGMGNGALNPAYMHGQPMNPMGQFGMQTPGFQNFNQRNRRYQQQMQPMSMPGYDGAYPGMYGGLNGMMQHRQNGAGFPQMMNQHGMRQF